MIHRKSIQSKIWHCCRNCRFGLNAKENIRSATQGPSRVRYVTFANLIREDDCTPLVRIDLSRGAEVILGDEKQETCGAGRLRHLEANALGGRCCTGAPHRPHTKPCMCQPGPQSEGGGDVVTLP